MDDDEGDRLAAVAALDGLANVFEIAGREMTEGAPAGQLGEMIAKAGDHFRLLSELLTAGAPPPPAEPHAADRPDSSRPE